MSKGFAGIYLSLSHLRCANIHPVLYSISQTIANRGLRLPLLGTSPRGLIFVLVTMCGGAEVQRYVTATHTASELTLSRETSPVFVPQQNPSGKRVQGYLKKS